MNRATLNYWIDLITALAFVVCCVTGLARLFPNLTVGMSSGGQPAILGVSVATWQVLHDWSGVVMAAGVGLHTALHFKWLVTMTRRQFGRHRRPAKAAQAGGAAAESVAPTVYAGSRAPRPGRRYTRQGFLALGGATGAALLLGGWALFGRDAGGVPDSAADAPGGESASATAGSSTQTGGGGYGRGNGRRAGSDGSGSSGGGSDASAATGATDAGAATATARVSIDGASCSGCGQCLQVCSCGVFAMSGGKAVVVNADACRLCGRCLQVCAPQAIALRA